MNWTKKSTSATLLVFALLNLLLYKAYETTGRSKPSSEPELITSISKSYQEKRPQVVFIGSSIVGKGVNTELFTKLTQMRSMKIWYAGGMSACWYLMLKNVVLQQKEFPSHLLIYFRNNGLTDPMREVMGHSREAIAGLAYGDEPELDRLVYIGGASRTEYFFHRQIPLFRRRTEVQEILTNTTKFKLVAPLVGQSQTELQRALERQFHEEKLDATLATIRQDELEKRLQENMDSFDKAVNKSFLPLFIELTKKHSIKLILVRNKTSRDCLGESYAKDFSAYFTKMRRYLKKHNITMLDYSVNEAIEKRHFGAGDHLSHEGKNHFTKLVAKDFLQLLNKD